MTPNAPGPLGTRAAADGGTMPAPVIRCFASTDHPAARALWERTPGVGLSAADERDAIERFLGRNPALSFVAARDGRVVGTILCGHDGRRGLIHHLVVAPDSRRRELALFSLPTAGELPHADHRR